MRVHWPCFLLCLVAWMAAPVRAGTDLAEPEADLFRGPLPHFELTVTRDQMEVLASQRSMGSPKGEATGQVRIGTNVFTAVAMQLKGSGSFRALKYRPSLTLKFKGDRPCFGLTKLHLNNSVHDPSRLNEVLGAELHIQSGVPTTRATPARVTLNGRDLGVYVLKEGFDRRFLSRHFNDPRGNLYDPRWGEDIDSVLESDSGPAHVKRRVGVLGGGPGRSLTDATQADRERLLQATEATLDQRLAELGRVLDINRFLTTMALQILTDDWDGYVRHHNNFRLYHDPGSDRFVFLPHGMDQLFGCPRGTMLWPEFTGIVARSLFAAPGVPERLKSRMEELQKAAFTETNVLALIEQTEVRLQAGLTDLPERDREFYHRQAAALCDRVRQRFRVLREGPPEPLALAAGEAQPITGWVASAEVPSTDLEERVGTDGEFVLAIRANSPAAYGSWRARLVLPVGRYRFEGVASVSGVRSNPEGRDPGVGLRVVPARRGAGLSGSVTGARVSHTFRVERATEVVFVAELSAHAGSVEFVRDSLRVVRLSPGDTGQ